MTFEKFVKDNYKDFYDKIISDYKAAEKAEKDTEIAKKEAEKADVRAKTKFYENDFEYEIEVSYKGFSDGTREEELEFYEAFLVFTEEELNSAHRMKLSMMILLDSKTIRHLKKFSMKRV